MKQGDEQCFVKESTMVNMNKKVIVQEPIFKLQKHLHPETFHENQI